MRRWHLLARHKRPSKNGSGPADLPQEATNGDGGGISIRDRLQTESSGGAFANKDLVRSDTIIDEDRIVGRDDQLGVSLTI